MQVTIDISDDRIRDLLCCALEGGSNYWCSNLRIALREGVTRQDLPNMSTAGASWREAGAAYHAPFVEGCSFTLDVVDEDRTATVGLAELHRGLALLRAKEPRHFGDFMAENEDGDTGDVFLQLCCFGEVIYG